MQYCFAVVHDVVIVHIDVVVIVVVDPWNLPLKFGQNWVINSWDLVDVLVVIWDIADIEFVLVGGGGGVQSHFLLKSNFC